MRRSVTRTVLLVLALVAGTATSASGVGADGVGAARAGVLDPAVYAQPTYSDIGGAGVHLSAVEALAAAGVLAGTDCAPGRFCPGDPLPRWVMAVWLVRILDGGDPAQAAGTGFADVDRDAWWAPHVDRLAELGVTKGCGAEPRRYCPDRAVNRAQMASFLVRAFALEPGPPAGFADLDEGDVHRANIDALAAVGVTEGCGADPPSYCPHRSTTRAQMSSFLHRAMALAADAPTEGIDTWDRAAVVDAYRRELRRGEPEWGYTGSVEGCDAGATSQAFRDSVLRRVNWYRRMAGLAAVVEDAALTATAQQKALIMLAQQALSHYPGADWACYREIDFPGENLGLGAAGIEGVDGYMQDSGDNNLAVGHRQQILSPFVTRIGTGNVRDTGLRYTTANAMHLAYDWYLASEVREPRGFVAWPPPGYVPAETVWGRWSFSMQRIETEVTRSGNTIYTRLFLSGPDFSQAQVAMSDDDGPVPATIIHRSDALVWAVDGDTDSDPMPAPTDGDHCYTITVNGVRIGGAVQSPFEYAVCVLDPSS